MNLLTARKLWETAYNSICALATEDGINASAKEEVYGCIFGRDSAITILKLLKVISENPREDALDTARLLEISKKSLIRLADLQGKEVNIESGEEPGKFIHEYRTTKYDHLLSLEKPWFLYPDKTLRNYDSIDATPLVLIAIYKYFELTNDIPFLMRVVPAVEKGLWWIVRYADLDRDYFLEYEFHKDRKFGGLPVQSWTDSFESLIQGNGKMPLYPIAPVEVQGYAWLAMKLWADFYEEQKNNYPSSAQFARKLRTFAYRMKKSFNNSFITTDTGRYFPVQALDGAKNKIPTITGNSLLLLWASYKKEGRPESILDDELIQDLVKRSFMPDLFDETAGLRTMSMLSKTFNAGEDSYHNGSFWPKLNGMVHEGLVSWGYEKEARQLRNAALIPLMYFQTPIELYIKTPTGEYREYRNSSGQVSCKTQAWSAAVMLDLLNNYFHSDFHIDKAGYFIS